VNISCNPILLIHYLFEIQSVINHPFLKNRKLIIANVKSNHSLKKVSVSLHTYTWFAFDIGIASVVSPFSLKLPTPCEKFSPLRQTTQYEKQEEKCAAERTRMELLQRRESFTVIFEIIWNTFKEWACVQQTKKRRRERERKEERKETADIASRSPFRRKTFLRDRSTCFHLYVYISISPLRVQYVHKSVNW